MVVNNLLIKLKQRDADSLAKAVSVLQQLKGNIPVLLDSHVETNVGQGTAACDIMLINTFAALEDIQDYLVHPVHMEVSDYIKDKIDTAASLCYEVK